MPKISLTCIICAKSFERYEYRIRPGQNSYCSPTCQNIGRQKTVILHCDNCGIEFEKTPSRIRDTANYCSPQCNYAARRIEYGDPPLCGCGCGMLVTRTYGGKWHKFIHGHNFTGKSHTEETKQAISEAGIQMSKERSERIRGDKNLMWRGGRREVYYVEMKASGFNPYQRRKVRKRLIKERGHKCQRCEDDNIKLELHHIDHNLFHNDDINFLLLCRKCHAIVTMEFIKNEHTTALL